MTSALRSSWRLQRVATVIATTAAATALALSPTAAHAHFAADSVSEPAPSTCPSQMRATPQLVRTGTITVGGSAHLDASASRIIVLDDCDSEEHAVTATRWELLARPAGSSTALTGAGLLVRDLPLDRAGNYRVRLTACPDGCTITMGPGTTISVPARSIETTMLVGAADLWVMAIEGNQGFQDQLWSHHRRAAGTPGLVDLSTVGGRPVIPGKPMVVRVLIGSRESDATATGRLLVRTSPGGPVTQLQPLQQGTDASCGGPAGVGTCASQIAVARPLGMLASAARSGADVDLVARRAHWGGTLNYVLSASLTSQLATGRRLELTAEVNPVGTDEAEPADNSFVVRTRNIRTASQKRLRVVRVSVRMSNTTYAAPTTTEALDGLEQMNRVLPWNHVAYASVSSYYYSGSLVRIKVWTPFGWKTVKTFNQCQSLWFKLVGRYGLSNSRPLMALLPADLPGSLTGCGNGMGWKVPGNGGAAFAVLPTGPADRSRIAVMAQELYHGMLDRRHVSSLHGENAGCPALGILKYVIAGLSLGSIDTDCSKAAPFTHGAIGAYPRSTSSMEGDRGGVGVDVYRDGATWRLRLIDPCPTGAIGGVDPTTWLRQRWLPGQSRCTVGDGVVAHDFMSYGPNRWTSAAQLFGGPTLSLVPG